MAAAWPVFGTQFDKPVNVSKSGKRNDLRGPIEVSEPNSPMIDCDSRDRLHRVFEVFGFGDLYGDALIYLKTVTGG